MLLHFASKTIDLSHLMVVMITIPAELGDLKRATDLGSDRSVAPHNPLTVFAHHVNNALYYEKAVL